MAPEAGSGEAPKLQIEHRRHDYLAATCGCGHATHAEPGWGVALTEWHLCGPRLVSFLVRLSLHLRGGARRKIQTFLRGWLEIDLSTSTVYQCSHEAGCAIAPVVDEQLGFGTQ